jgi:hypothetical protein
LHKRPTNTSDLEQWRELVQDGHKKLNATLKTVRENAKDLETFTKSSYLPTAIVGNVIALATSILLTRRLLHRFKSAVLKVRQGHAEGKMILATKERSGITAIQIPKMVGMTLMSFWLNFYIVSYIVSMMLGVLFGPWLFKMVESFGLVGIAVETALVAVICVVGLDTLVGKKILLGGSDDMMHPIWWTWYACLMLLSYATCVMSHV